MFSRRLKGAGAVIYFTATGFGVGLCSLAPTTRVRRLACFADNLRPAALDEAFFIALPPWWRGERCSLGSLGGHSKNRREPGLQTARA